jgi:hypothetical protein
MRTPVFASGTQEVDAIALSFAPAKCRRLTRMPAAWIGSGPVVAITTW